MKHLIFKGNFLFFSIVFLLGCAALPSPLFARDFDKDFILSDFEFTDVNAFSSAAGVEYFLIRKGSGLVGKKFVLEDGTSKTAAEIVWDAARKNNISPKFLVTLLQKESGLATEPNPSQDAMDWAMGAGICDSCSKDDPAIIAKYKGFGKQVYWAAELNRWYADEIAQTGKTFTGWGPGIKKRTLDGIEVTPANTATAALYTYNPFIGRYGGGDPNWGANSLLWKQWTEWFTRLYPDGSLLRETGKDGVWLLQNGLLRPFLSKAALLSLFDPKKIIDVGKTDLDLYQIGKPIKFPNYSFLRSPKGTVYLLADEVKRGFDSREALRRLGIQPDEIVDVSFEELADYPEGEPITPKSAYPAGALLQDKKTGGVFLVKDGIKHPIWSKEIMKTNFPSKKVIPVTSEELEGYATSEPVPFRDGELVASASSPAVYVVSDGMKRPIVSGEVFEALGYRWENIVKTSDRALETMPTGAAVNTLTGSGVGVAGVGFPTL